MSVRKSVMSRVLRSRFKSGNLTKPVDERWGLGVRPEVVRLAGWAPLPSEDEWEDGALEDFGNAVNAVQPPLTGEESAALLPLLDRPYEDSIYGVLWGVLHLIESCDYTGWQPVDHNPGAPWLQRLRRRWMNGERQRGRGGPASGRRGD